jgi:predicted transcriptional regulator
MSKKFEALAEFVENMEGYGAELMVQNSNMREHIRKLEEANKRGNEILQQQKGVIAFLEAKLARMTEMYEDER